MRKMTVLTAMLVVFVLAGCGTTAKSFTAGNFEGVQFERTGPFGTDYAGAVIASKSSVEVENLSKIRLEKYFHQTIESWDQGCPSPKQRRNIKHKETTENSYEDVVNPAYVNQHSRSTTVVGGYNPSGGNTFMSTLPLGAGMIGGAALLRPDRVNNNTEANSNAEINNSGNSSGGKHEKRGR
jgi:hypothetical protein